MKAEHIRKKAISYGKDNRGMSLVTVIIVIGFVSILVSILLMTSLINLKMKQVNAYAKDSFYSAEQVLDEISIGLQKDISDALSSSYSEVLTDYAGYDTQRKNEILQTKYYEYLWNVLGAGGSNQQYSTDTLYAYLKDTTKWRGTDEVGYGAILRVRNADGTNGTTGTMVTYANTGIVLEDLVVYYKDAKGFVSTIQTDIRLAYPDFDFAASTVLPDVPKYSFIADDGFTYDRPGGGNLTIAGSVYADNFTVSANDSNVKANIEQTGTNQFIIKHDMNLTNASFTNDESGEFWASDILADSSNLSLLGTSNVADDLDIKGNESNITLEGIYNGFGNSLTDSSKSSAILVNGSDATLDLARLTRIMLAGHAYVGTNRKNVSAVGGTTTGGSQIFTGESLAVKSNQLLYLIPAQCLWVSDTTGESVYGENPISVTSDSYNELLARDDLTEVAIDMEVSGLGDNLTKYLKQINGVPQPERVFIPTSDPNTTLVYYYMNFANEDVANEYFARYYNGNKTTYDEYMSFYAKEIKFPNTDSMLRLRLAGNAIMGSEETGYENKTSLYTGASTKFAGTTATDTEIFTALTTKLIRNYNELKDLSKEPSETDGVVFENIVDVDKMKDYINRFGTAGAGTFTMTERVDGRDATVVLTNGNYVVADANVHLVIAGGDVIVAVPNFVGTIIADGEITTGAAVTTMAADEDLVKAMLRFQQEVDGTAYTIATVLKDGSELMYSSIAGGEETDSVSLESLVVYENWTKE